jgi:hypothetical protein
MNEKWKSYIWAEFTRHVTDVNLVHFKCASVSKNKKKIRMTKMSRIEENVRRNIFYKAYQRARSEVSGNYDIF